MIRRHAVVGPLVGALLASALAVAPAFAEVVSTPPAEVSTATVSVAMDNDWQFADAECVFIPILVTYGRADVTSILGETTVTKPGSDATGNEGTFLVLPGDAVGGQLLDEVFVCPADGTGEYRLDTQVRAIDPDAEQVFALDPVSFWVRPARSRMSDVRARSTKGGTRVSGRVLAGDGVATGVVEIRYRTPGAARWRLATAVPVEDGDFVATVDRHLPPRTRVKATLVRCSWCSRVSAVVRAS